MASVTFAGVSKHYGRPPQKAAVSELDLTLAEGTLVTLLGPSGCGKTTTLRMLAGFERPSSGRILIDGSDVTDKPVRQRDVGIVFQNYALFPHMTVRENVNYGLESRGPLTPELRRRIDDILALMSLGDYADRAPNQLSGGQQQRVAVARAVVTRPRVLLFDEPLSNLDAQLRERVRDDLRAIQQDLGITSLYVTHDQSEALAISDRVVVMNQGRVEQDAEPEMIYARPVSEFVARFMGRANIIRARIAALSPLADPDVLRANVAVNGLEFVADGWRGHLAGKSVGDLVTCVIRPESIVIGRDASGPTFPVVRKVFQGMQTEYHFDFAGDGLLVFDTSKAAPLKPGDRVPLDLSAAKAWIVSETGGTPA